MQLGILGSGSVGRTIGARLVELGHDVTIGTRDVAKTLARTEPDVYGNPPFNIWQQQHPRVRLGTFADAAAFGAVVINATNDAASLEALSLAGAANLDGKVLDRHRQRAGFLAGHAAVTEHRQHRLVGRADPARLPQHQGGQDPQHHERLCDGAPAAAGSG